MVGGEGAELLFGFGIFFFFSSINFHPCAHARPLVFKLWWWQPGHWSRFIAIASQNCYTKKIEWVQKFLGNFRQFVEFGDFFFFQSKQIYIFNCSRSLSFIMSFYYFFIWSPESSICVCMHACVHVCFLVRELGFFPSAISCISYSWIGNAKHGDSGLMLEFCHTCIFIIITKPHLGFPINNFFFYILWCLPC